MKVGLGLVSFGRTDYRERTVAAIHRHLSDCVDVFTTAYDVAPVAKAKNQVMREMLDAACTHVFVIEDDILVQSQQAIVGYVEALVESGWAHLNFHGHGPANPSPRRVHGPVTYWPNMVGAYSVWTRESLEAVGLMDERMHNAYEHCFHTQLLAQAGFTSKWPECADATGSEHWLTEIPGSIENSSIRHTPEWYEQLAEAKRLWQETSPETYGWVFP